MSTKNSQLRESFYKNAKQQVVNAKAPLQDSSSKTPAGYGQQKKASHKDLSPSAGFATNTQFFNNPYNSQIAKNRSNGRSNNISPINRYVSPKVAEPQNSKMGQKRAQSSCRPSINNPNNQYDGSLFSVLDQFKMSPQMPLNLGKSQEFSQQQVQQSQNHQSQKRKIRVLRQSIGSRQATRNDDPPIDEYECLNNVSNINTNYNFMEQTPMSRKSQTRKDVGNQNPQRFTNNSQLQGQHYNHAPPQISPNNIGDAYFKNSVFQANTPLSIKTPSSYVNGNNSVNNPQNPVIIRNSINNISVQIGNCNDLTHSFKLSNKHSKDHQMENQLYDFNLDNIDSPRLPTDQVYRIDTNISDERINTQATNKDINRTTNISTNNSKSFDPNTNNLEDRQSRIYALQNYLKNTQTTKYSRNSRRSAAHSSHTSNQVKQIIENNLIHSESKQSKNSTTVSNLNTNNITKISDENSNPEYQQTIKKQLNCIQVGDIQTGHLMGATAAPRNKSPLPQKIFQKFDQNIQILGQTDPCNIKVGKKEKNLLNSYMDPTIITNQGNNGYSQQNQAKMQQQTVTTNIANTPMPQMPQLPQQISNQDVEELHFQFVEFQQKCKEWLKKIEL